MNYARKITLAALLLFAVLGAQAATWEIDQVHSSIGFKVKHLMVSNVRGSFDHFSGTVVYEEGNLKDAKVEVSITAASINTANTDRDTHLKSPDFFDVEKYPTLEFVSKLVEKSGSGLKILGDLTMHGVTKEIVLNVMELTDPVVDPWGGIRRGASAAARINRTDFGLSWNKALETGGLVVGEDVDILLEVELVKK
ncbi:MAG: YceI family protein [bacterium]